MREVVSGPGPDVVLAGSARSGTSFLAARLSAHADVDGGAVKEPNYFSRNLHLGASWYDDLFEPRSPDLRRLDASMSYTVPKFPDALRLLLDQAPECRLLYAVRDPFPRAVSHYRLLSQYFESEAATDFGSAILENDVYLGASDYSVWLDRIHQLWDPRKVLIIPFSIITDAGPGLDEVARFLDLSPLSGASDAEARHRNEVVEFKHDWVRRTRESVVKRGWYPAVRRWLGPDRIRRLRGTMTRPATGLSVDDAWSSCSPRQQEDIAALVERSRQAVDVALAEQDERRGLDWASAWRGARG